MRYAYLCFDGMTDELVQCVDIEFVESDDDRVESVNDDNCFNSTNIEFTDEEDQSSGDSDESDSEGNVSSRLQAAGLMSMMICFLSALALT